MTNTQYTKKTNPKTAATNPLYVMAVGGSGAGQAVNSDGSTNVKITDGINTAGLIQMSGDSIQSNAIGTNSGSFGFVYNGTTWDRLRSANAANDNASGVGLLSNVPRMFNGSGLDRMYNNTQGTLLASLARTTGPSSPIQTNYNAKGVIIFLNVTAASGTGGLAVNINAVDPITGGQYGLNVSPAAVTAVGEYMYVLYPGATSSGNGVKQSTALPLPRQWQVYVSVGDASSYTYSIGYAYIL